MSDWSNWKCSHAPAGCNYPDGECIGACEIKNFKPFKAGKQAEPVAFNNDAAWGLAQKVRTDLDRKSCPGAFMDLAMESINRHYPDHAATFVQSEPVAFVRIGGTVGWNIDYSKLPYGTQFYTHPAPAVAQGRATLKATGLHSERDGKMYQTCEVLSDLIPDSETLFYTETPAVAVNEQLLQAAQRVLRGMKLVDENLIQNSPSFSALEAAIAAAEAAKGGV